MRPPIWFLCIIEFSPNGPRGVCVMGILGAFNGLHTTMEIVTTSTLHYTTTNCSFLESIISNFQRIFNQKNHFRTIAQRNIKEK